MPKSKDLQPESNDVVVRIRMTKDLAAAFTAECAERGISDASGGRLAIFNWVKAPHYKRTMESLPAPDVTDRAWGKKSK